MTKSKTYRTKTGRVLSDDEVNALADEVENTDYDIAKVKSRRRGRPAMGSGPADVVPVRLDPELRKALEDRAAAEQTSSSEVIRRALRSFLDVA
jgi:hypothetical protein